MKENAINFDALLGTEGSKKMAIAVSAYTQAVMQLYIDSQPEVDRLKALYPTVPSSMLRWVALNEIPLKRVLEICGVSAD